MVYNERIVWADYAKSIGIFCVVLGHTLTNYPLRSFIYAFHIPLFFFISGMFFSFEKYPRYGTFLKKRFLQLVVPYLIFNFITYIFWVFVGRKLGNDAHLSINEYHPLVGIFYGHLSSHFLEHCAPLWFIACLFMVENIYYFVFKKIKQPVHHLIILSLFVVFGYLDYKFVHVFLPWGINVALSVMIFYGVGVLYNKYLAGKYMQNKGLVLLVFIVALSITYAVSVLNGKIEVSMREFNNYLYYLIGGFIGILMVVAFSKLEERKLGVIKWQKFIGENTIIILALHLMAASFLKGIMFYLLKLDINSFQEHILLSILFSIASILVLIPVILFVNRYIPWVIGRKRAA